MASLTQKLRPYRIDATENALKLVHAIISRSKEPLSTQKLYKAVVREEVSLHGTKAKVDPSQQGQSPEPPFPNHEVRSMRYLKTVILPELVQQERIKKIHSVRTLSKEEIEQRLSMLSKSARQKSQLSTTADVWSWVAVKPRPKPEPQPEPEPFGKAVGVGEDWSHLNKRRQRAREEKVENDVEWLHKLEKARAKGLQEGSNPVEASPSLTA